MAWPRLTDPTTGQQPPPDQLWIQQQMINDVAESASAPGGGAALGDPGGNGIVVRTALGVTAARTLTGPAAGLTITNGNGVSGNPTFALANDLAAIEALSGVGVAQRTGTDAWSLARIADNGTVIDIGDDANFRLRIDESSTMVSLNCLPVSLVLDSDAETLVLTAPGGTRLASLTSNGFIKTNGGDGSLSIDTNTYATQAYADSLVIGLLDDRGNYDASGNVFPSSGGSGSAGAVLKGDLWTISVAGTLGSVAVSIGDQVRALTDTPGQTASNWAISEANIGYVPLSQSLADGKIYIGNGSGIGTAVTPSGDVTISNAGVTAIGALKVLNSMIANATIDLTAKVTGILPSANGGTGSAFFGVAGPSSLHAYTFPDANATIARTDAAQTFTGTQTFSLHVNPLTNYTSNLGALDTKYLALHVAEIWAQTLVAQNTLATLGGRVLIAPTTPLTADLAAGGTTITVKYNNLNNGDRIYLEASGKVEFMAVTSAAGGSAGAYTYTVTRDLDGSGANQWFAGDAVVNTGTTGNGFIDLYSVQGVIPGSTAGPTIVGNVRTSTAYNAISPRWAIGNLNGLYGYSGSVYGAAFGVPAGAWIKIDPTNGVRLGFNTTTNVQVDASGNATFSGALSAATGSFSGSVTATSGAIGGLTIASSKVYVGTGTFNNSNTAFYVDNAGQFSLKDKLSWDGTTLSINGGGTFSGALSAATGTFAGALSAATGSFAGSLSAASGTFTGDLTGAGMELSGALEVTGEITAGGGDTVLDGDGITLLSGHVFSSISSYKILDAATSNSLAFFSAYYDNDGVSINHVGLQAESFTAADTRLQIYAYAPTGRTCTLSLAAHVNGVIQAGINLGSTGVYLNGVVQAGSGPTTLTDAAGKILSAALNTVAVGQGGTGLTTLTANTVYKGNGTSPLAASQIIDTGTAVGIGMTPAVTLDVTGTTADSSFRIQRSNNAHNVQFIAKPAGALAVGNPQYSFGIQGSASRFNFQMWDGTTAVDAIQISTAGLVDIPSDLVIGSPTGGHKGTGSINAVTVWRNGTSLDRVFESDYALMPIPEMREFYESNKHLPTIPRSVNDEGSTDIGALGDATWETVEVHAIYIAQLEQRIQQLESQLRSR